MVCLILAARSHQHRVDLRYLVKFFVLLLLTLDLLLFLGFLPRSEFVEILVSFFHHTHTFNEILSHEFLVFYKHVLLIHVGHGLLHLLFLHLGWHHTATYSLRNIAIWFCEISSNCFLLNGWFLFDSFVYFSVIFSSILLFGRRSRQLIFGGFVPFADCVYFLLPDAYLGVDPVLVVVSL